MYMVAEEDEFGIFGDDPEFFDSLSDANEWVEKHNPSDGYDYILYNCYEEKIMKEGKKA